MTQIQKVTAALKRAGLKFVQHESDRFWIVMFDINGKKKRSMLFLPGSSAYFFAISPIESEKIAGRLDDIPADVLRTIIRISSSVPLAKVDCVEPVDNVGFIAMSQCSTEGFTGPKLHRRLEACAKLAVRVEDALGKMA
jgi:hypothetical protein